MIAGLPPQGKPRRKKLKRPLVRHIDDLLGLILLFYGWVEMPKKHFVLRFLPFNLAATLALTAVSAAAPFEVAPALFDRAAPGDLGLRPAPGTETVTVFRPGPGTDKFANGVALAGFKGRLYVQWQSSARSEDTPDTWTAYAVSTDGTHWSPPRRLAGPEIDGAMRTSGGWWSDGRTLVAFVNVWPQGFRAAGGTHPGGYAEYRLSKDGEHWSPPHRVLGKDGHPVEGIIEQDPHALPSGRIVTAFHLRPGLMAAPFYTDDPLGISGWVRGRMENLPHTGDVSRELEPSWWRRTDGCLTMAFRDEGQSFRVLAAESCDQGQSWSRPEQTDLVDARAKLAAGNLPDGTAYLVNSPSGVKTRIPLVVNVSADGRRFTRSYLLRGAASLAPIVSEGTYKRPGFHYPKSTVWNGALYVGYAVNKEDVAITRVPILGLKP